MSYGMIDKNILEQSADAIKDRIHSKTPIAPVNFADAINKIPWGIKVVCKIGRDGQIGRPDGWADISKLPKEDNTVYFVVDNTGRIDDTPINFTFSGSAYSVEVGRVVNGTYVRDSITNINANGTYSANASTLPSGYPVVRIHSDGSLTDFRFNGSAINGHTYVARYNAIVEASGVFDSYGTGIYGTYWLEIDSRRFKRINSVNSLSATWQNCYSLQSLDLSGWNTSNWTVNSLQYTWQNCYSLQTLDLSGWDTSKMTYSDMQRTFYLCENLGTLDLSVFDVSKITNLGNSSYPNFGGRLTTNIVFGEHNKGKFKPTSYKILNISRSIMMSREGLLNCIDALADGVTGYTLNMGGENLNKLTSAEKKIATDKGWTLV